jgi:integrase/recombinase XerD
VTQLRQKMLEELQRRNYSHRTAKTYVRIVREFATYFQQPPDKLGPEQIRQYQAHLFQAKKLAPATVSPYVSALRFLFIKTLRRHFLAEYIPFPKSRKRLPTVLSPEEVARLLDSARNLYHRTLLMTLYSTAMRRAELCRLKVRDIDSQRMMIRIDQGKGGRDRDVPLSPTLLETLRVYWRWMKPTTFLFPGTVKGVRAGASLQYDRRQSCSRCDAGANSDCDPAYRIPDLSRLPWTIAGCQLLFLFLFLDRSLNPFP